MEHALGPTADPAWVLDADGYDALRESSLESRFAISNGFLGIRGARAITRGARWVVPPRTYVAGLFDTAGTERATPGLVPAADWLQPESNGSMSRFRGCRHRFTPQYPVVS
jgi:trehalose/maltose hydrolase-like predicted phosphorylase